MKTKKPNGAEHPAINSNVAAKQNGGVKLDPEQAYKLGGLVSDLRAAQERLDAANKDLSGFLAQCASSKGIKLEEYDLRTDTMTFVPKSAARVIVQ